MTSLKENLDQLAEQTQKVALQGLDDASGLTDRAKISARVSFQKKLVVEAGEFTLATSEETQKLSIGVHKDNKKGSASVNTLDPQSVKQAISDAAALAKFSVADENLVMPSAEQAPAAAPLPFMWNDALAETSLEEMQGYMAEGLARVTRDKRVALDRFEMAIHVSSHGLYNSLGVCQTEKQTMAHWVYFGMAREGDQVSTFDYDGNFTLDKNQIQADLMRDAEAFERSVIKMLNPRKGPTYKGCILLTPRAVQGLLTGTLFFHASGRQIMDGKSQWSNSIGQAVASSNLTIRDTPHSPALSGCTSFDHDGLPTRDHTIVENGVLKLHTYDCYSAKKLGQQSNAFNGGPFAVTINPGDRSLADLYKEHDELLVVDRFSGNTDPLKGDFSGVAKASRLFVKGEDVGTVTETMIAGNVLEALKSVVAMSKETEQPFGSFSSPYILIDGVSVSGG